MNIQAVIKILNKELDANITADYYTRIEEWRQWWAGYVKSFHKFSETTDTGKKKERTLYSLKMAKKICEDWAACLLNEKTQIVLEDKASSEFLQGPEEEQSTGGVFGNISFWDEANSLVEKAFYSGTGAFVMKLDGLLAGQDGTVLTSPEAGVRMEYLPAMNIFPITVRYHQITEVAFASENTVRGQKYVYLEIHTLENGLYVIQNRYFKCAGNGALTPASLPDGVAERINTGSPYPFFSIIHPNIVNPYDNNLGLGCSVFSQAIDNLKGTDIAYNNFNRDLWLGGKKVFYNREMTRTIGVDEDGKPIYITPDDMLQQLFVSVGDEFGDEKKLVHEFNPDLRVTDNRDAVQAQLDYLSFKCGMGARHYRFDTAGGVQVTATQYTGEKQELKQNASKHGIVVEQALQSIVRAILWAGKNILGQPVDPETAIVVVFSDGYIVSDDEKKADDRQDILNGVMQRYEYRMKWYGEDEATAKAKTQPPGPVYGRGSFPPGEDE